MNDRLRILEMVKEGKVTPEEGERLLEELNRAPRGPAPILRVRISSPGGPKVQFTIPVSVAGSVLALIPETARKKLETRGIDLDQLIEAIRTGDAIGQIVDIKEPGGTSVEVTVE
ncbi:MAG TPA: hypothetical protein VFH67_02195 [bacterium]|nr:hypothetical protein [bacterium]